MKRKTVIFGIVVIILIIGAIFFVVKRKHEISTLPKPQVHTPAVETARVESGEIEATRHYLGAVEPLTKSDLSPRISGNILMIAKREGDRVREGERVATIDSRELMDKSEAVRAEYLSTQERLGGAKSAYETQKSIYERDKTLYQAGAISQEALERSQAAYEGAQATMSAFQESIKGLKRNASAARTQAEYANIIAPFSGVVTKRWNEPGDLAIPGKPILTIEKASPYRVIAQLPAEEIGSIKNGARVYLRSGDQILAAAVTRVYPAVGRNLLGSIEILLSTTPFHLPSGATVGVDLVAAKVAGLIVPENALVRSDRGNFVFVAVNNVVHVRPVQILGAGRGKIAVSGDVKAGDTVIVGQENRLLSLREGTKIQLPGAKDKP
ncbi:MAG: efflux RND transporter periplasmic adaptor subunit [Deltaproteobacteria bacterium]|nr:efflux RND transporter periplasmic adaptor subunit [Deltaproteobacteria bacterium]